MPMTVSRWTARKPGIRGKRARRTAGPVTAALARRKSAGVAINMCAGYTRFMTSESRFLPCEYGFLRGKSDVHACGVAPFAVDFRACLP